MRGDDLQRLAPHLFEVRGEGLVGRLVQTKTTGKNKKVRALPLYISRECWVTRPGWMRVGARLLGEVRPVQRDPLLPRFTRDWREATGTPASPADLGAMCVCVMAALRQPVVAAGVWVTGDVPLIPEPLAVAWTGHAERTMLPGAQAAMGVAREERDPLGRWARNAAMSRSGRIEL